VPDVLDINLIDEIIKVADKDAASMAKRMSAEEGIFAGISAGAAMAAAINIAKREENEGKIIVVIIPDLGDRYLSTDIYN